MSTIGKVWRETRHQSRVFWRVPISAFFTFAFPLMFLVLFDLLNGNSTIDALGGLRFAQFFTPSLAVFGMVTAAYTNLAIQTSIARDEGVLKRVRGTPLPPWIFMAGKIGSALWVGVSSVVVMFAVGAGFFHVTILWNRVPVAFLILVVGAACFSALGLAAAAVAPNAQAAPAVANATILPLAFVSGIFFPLEGGPHWLVTAAGIFPLRPFAASFTAALNPLIPPPSVPWGDLAIMAVWFAAGLVLAVRFFSWEPRPVTTSRRAGRRTPPA